MESLLQGLVKMSWPIAIAVAVTKSVLIVMKSLSVVLIATKEKEAKLEHHSDRGCSKTDSRPIGKY